MSLALPAFVPSAIFFSFTQNKGEAQAPGAPPLDPPCAGFQWQFYLKILEAMKHYLVD